MSGFGWIAVAVVVLVVGYVGVRRARRPVVHVPAPLEVRVEPVPEPIVELPPEPVPASVPEPAGEVVPRPPVRGSRRWAALLTVTAPVVSAGLYVHHRRFERYHAHKGLPQPPGFGAWLRSETVGAGTLGWWHVTGFLRDGLRVPPNAVGRPVLCVHGYSQNATNFVGLRRALEADGRPTVAVSLRHRLAPIEWYAARLAGRITEMVAAHPDGIDVVAHSMGGVVLRLVLHGHPELRAHVRTAVTLGSPHRGTAATRGVRLVPELVALGRRSTLLRDLPQLPDLLPHGRVVTIAGDTDTVVYPVETSLVPGAEAVVLPGIGHAGLLTSPLSWDAVRRALRAAA